MDIIELEYVFYKNDSWYYPPKANDHTMQILGRTPGILGERLNGIQEVSASIPLISTKKQPETKVLGCFSNIWTINI